jgi:hypothetical protein
VVGEQGAHLGRALEVELLTLELEPLGVGQHGPGLDAEQHLVGAGVLPAGVVEVVGGQQGHAEVAGQGDQVGVDPALLGQAVVVQLGEVVARPEQVAELGQGRGRALAVALEQALVDLGAEAAGGGDQPLAVALEQLPVHAGLVEVALQGGQRHQPQQVGVAGLVLGQQGQVAVGLGDVAALLLEPGTGGQVGFDPEDRLDPVLLAGQVEVDGPEQLAVVGHGQGRHAHAGGLGEELIDPGGSIEHRVLGVHVEVREAARHDCCCSPYRLVPNATGPEFPTGCGQNTRM